MATLLESHDARRYLKEFKFDSLFTQELGWDHYNAELDVTVSGRTIRLKAVAEKRGFVVYVCPPEEDGGIPDYQTRLRIEKKVSRIVHEHLVIFLDRKQREQVWQWVKRQPGKPMSCREHHFVKTQPGDALLSKLEALKVSLDEEESLTIVDVGRRARKAFDIDKVTKRFYDRFKDERDAFQKFIDGIPNDEDERWYVSVMLNRLMFIYFIEKKGFLDSNVNYLRDKLNESKAREKDRYYSEFLRKLFFEGFAQRQSERTTSDNKLLGKIPYLNGSLFIPHEIEERYGKKIQIPDKTFVKLFDFFEQYHWHLDERPVRLDNEINPDVLGYVYEKYINQKQMGAYYTKEDITEYISKNTIIPFLFDKAKEECHIAFEGEQSVWRLLGEDPDRYIYEAVRRGVILADGSILPEKSLPDFVRKGMHDPKARMFDKRYNLGEAAIYHPPLGGDYRGGINLALPTETWREYVHRRNRCLELRERLSRGEIHEINDLITYNLDIRQFAQDVITSAEGPHLVAAFWKAITEISVLDPTCGSGAFLFAALNILEPLYDACLDRMEWLLENSDLKTHSGPGKVFKDALDNVARHANRKYFILKSIIVNNLYGVDIMDEAVEICKLRLFLKLVAQVGEFDAIEPLPDIDFNIRAGNTLVGYARSEDMDLPLGFEAGLKEIERKAMRADDAWTRYKKWQLESKFTADDLAGAKQELKDELSELAEILNAYLAQEYSLLASDKETYPEWLNSHKPFHWFTEFYGIMKKSGFDVIIGNPPYVEYAKVKDDYSVRSFLTEVCANLFAFMIERSSSLLREHGRLGMIIPMSSVSTQKMAPLVDLMMRRMSEIYLSHYSGDAHPAVLFNGVKMRLSILLSVRRYPHDNELATFTTDFVRWYAESRPYLFSGIRYASFTKGSMLEALVPKTQTEEGIAILRKLVPSNAPIGQHTLPESSFSVYAHRIVAHFVKCFDRPPYFRNDRDGEKKSEDYKVFSFKTPLHARLAVAVLNSTTFYYYYLTYSDAYHCGRELLLHFPCDLAALESGSAGRLRELSSALIEDLHLNSVRRRIEYHGTGWIDYDEFYPKHSKPIIDRIDCVLAEHYGFTDEELDFIINYDIKYRMGRGAGEAES